MTSPHPDTEFEQVLFENFKFIELGEPWSIPRDHILAAHNQALAEAERIATIQFIDSLMVEPKDSWYGLIAKVRAELEGGGG